MIKAAVGVQRWPRVGGIILVNIATFTWATNILLGRWLRDDIGPITLTAGRFTVGALVFVLLLRGRPAEDRRLAQDFWWLLGMALTGIVIFAPLLYLGLRFTTVVNATLVNGFGPLITGLLAAVLIGEAMTRRQVSGAIMGLAGVVILISGGSSAIWSAIQGGLGDLIVLGAVTLWGVYSVLGRRVMQNRSPLSSTAFSAFIGLPLLILAAVWEMQVIPVRLSPELIIAIIYIGIAPTVAGFLAWNVGVRRLGPAGAMIFFNTLPLYGALLGFLFLGESIGLPHVLGGALIIAGGVWAARRTN